MPRIPRLKFNSINTEFLKRLGPKFLFSVLNSVLQLEFHRGISRLLPAPLNLCHSDFKFNKTSYNPAKFQIKRIKNGL